MIVILGDSHMRAIVNAYATFSDKDRADIAATLNGFQCGMIGPAFSFAEPFWTKTDQGVVFTKSMQERFTSLVGADNDTIVPGDEREFIFSIGSQPTLLHVDGLWNNHTAGRHVESATHLSRDGFRVVFLHHNRYIFGFFKVLKELAVKFSVLAEPPPSLQFAFLQQKGERGLDLWHLHGELIKQELDRMGVQIEFPPATVREHNAPDGFLRLTLCDSHAPNSPHGNKEYGDIFLRSMLRQRGVPIAIEDNGDRYDSPEVLRNWYCRIGFSMANTRHVAAHERFASALKIDATHKESMFGLGYAHDQRGLISRAEAQYKATLAKYPDYADCWAALAALKIASKEMEEAKTAMNKAIELKPSRLDRRLRLGAILEKLNDNEGARQVLREALFDDGSGDAVPTLKADPLGLNGARLAIPVEPDAYDAATHSVRSVAPFLVILGRVERGRDASFAERCFQLALEIDDRPEWRSYLGDIYFAREDWAAAVESYRPAVEKFPNNSRFTERLAVSMENQAALLEAP